MKKYFLRVVVASGFFLTTFAQAANEELPWPPGNEERNLSFNLFIGSTDIKEELFHDQTSIFKLQGGSRFSDFFALEVGFVYYGEGKDLRGNVERELEGHAIELQILGIAPLQSWFELFGKVGASKWRFKGKETTVVSPGVFVVSEGKVKGEDLIYGGGLLFNVDHDSTIRVEYEQYDFDGTDFKVLILGFMHRF